MSDTTTLRALEHAAKLLALSLTDEMIDSLRADYGNTNASVLVHWKAEVLAHLEVAESDRWQPIETAPKDGTLFLVWAPGVEGLPSMYSLCAYHPDAGFCIDELRKPTHWMPLPLTIRHIRDKENSKGVSMALVPVRITCLLCNGLGLMQEMKPNSSKIVTVACSHCDGRGYQETLGRDKSADKAPKHDN